MPATATASSARAGELILLFTAFIWGLSFACQRLGMRHLGPYEYNAASEWLGGFCILLTLLACRRWRKRRAPSAPAADVRRSIKGGSIAGGVFFLAVSFQQHGLILTTAGNSGFLTSLYVVLVPVMGIALGRRPHRSVWLGAALAIAGVYFISGLGGNGWRVERGDALTIISAFFWAAQIMTVDWFAEGTDAMVFSATQFFVAALPTTAIALATESPSLANFRQELGPVLYSGIASLGIGFTAQAFGQKLARAGRASIIMSTEAFFAALGGVIMLGETVSWRMGLGAALMFAGMIAARAESKA